MIRRNKGMVAVGKTRDEGANERCGDGSRCCHGRHRECIEFQMRKLIKRLLNMDDVIICNRSLVCWTFGQTK